jgi:hypothetical protein
MLLKDILTTICMSLMIKIKKSFKRILDNILSNTMFDEIMSSKDSVLISIDKILKTYFE